MRIDIVLEKASQKKPKPTNPDLWARAQAEAKKRYDVHPSAYSNSFAAKWYKEKGGKWNTSESVELLEYSGGLRKWHKEKWVDISRKKKDGSHPECGSSDDNRKGYPKCVPKSKASSMDEKEKKSSSSRKQRAERETKRVDKKPINVSTKKDS